MDKRKSYKIVLDTETAPIEKQNLVNPYNMLCYDIGWVIVDKKGKVYKTQSFICSEIFFGEEERMKSSYYAKKIPQYLEDIKSGKRKVASYYEIKKALKNDCETWNVNEIYAHNARFDYGALKTTARWIEQKEKSYFYPKSVLLCDTLKMANDTICKQKSYRKFCEENQYLTKNNQLRKTAEILYRYISGNKDFIESHTGLEDVLIEKEIMVHCYRQKKKMRKNLWKD